MFRLLIIVAFTVLSFALSGPALAQNFDVDEMLKKAQSGDAVAQYTIGVAYWIGDGVPANKDEAVKWADKTRYFRCGTNEANFSDFKKVLPGDIAQ